VTDPLKALLLRAFGQASAADANLVIDEVRADEASELAEALSYEIVLPASEPVAFLTSNALPKLVYFLECRGVRIPRCPHIFVSLFAGDRLYFLRCEDFIDELSTLTGLSPAEMVKRYGG
jgi:hypothetical protein